MPKVTSKLQLTVPKAIAEQYGIKPGDNLQWVPAGEIIRVVPEREQRSSGRQLTIKERLKLFDQATERQRRREAKQSSVARAKENDRGWRREELYQRGRTD